MIQGLLTLIVFSLLIARSEATVPAESIELLKKVDAKYLSSKATSMSVTKTDKLSALEQVKTFQGSLQLKKGKFRLELSSLEDESEKTLVIVDGQFLWFVTPPLKDVKASKTQVAKTKISGKKSSAQSLLRTLTDGGVLKFFEVTKSVDQEDMIIYFLKPLQSSREMQKAQVLVQKEKQVIAQLKYWDALENETTYQFTNIEFNQNIKDQVFKYSPPKEAQVTTY